MSADYYGHDSGLERLKRMAIEAELRCYKKALEDRLDAERRLRVHRRELAALGADPEKP